MSSNIRLEKSCGYCSQQFIAKTVHTRYCSHTCNRKHYKALKRSEKIDLAQKKSSPAKTELSKKEYLSIKEAAEMVGVHPRTIMNLIRRTQLPAYRIGRRVIICTSDIKLFLKTSSQNSHE